MIIRILPLLLVFLSGCVSQQPAEVRGERIRTFASFEPAHSHPPVTLQVGWIPYEEWILAGEGSQRSVIRPDSNNTIRGEMPAIFVMTADSSDGFWLDPDTDDELLGKLIKASLMTQTPITRPFEDFLANATCDPCHPDGVGIRR